METEQLNIRVPKELLLDLDVIAELLKVNRSQWIKTKLAEDVYEEKNRLLVELSTLYAKGIISKKQVSRLAGESIADEMEFVKEKAEESARKGIELGRKLKNA